jgi:uncharacterized SAM-binding protein YcdF (DUF218 family)
MPLTGRAARALRAVGAVSLALFLAVAFTPVAAWASRWLAVRAALAPASAIVVLGGGGVRADGSLTDVSLRRTLHGIDLYQRGLAPLLVVSGPRLRAARAEGEARAALARRLGVPAAAIVTETAARTTREEAVRIAATLAPRGARRVLLVADAQGMRRALAVFRHAGLEPLPAPADDVPGAPGTPTARLLVAQRVLVEAVATAYYLAAGYL